jgi:hypothetical protein
MTIAQRNPFGVWRTMQRANDGKFGIHLFLPFVVVSGGEDTYYTAITDMYGSGHDSNLMAILIFVALSLMVMLLTAMTYVLRFRAKTRAQSTSEKPVSKPSTSEKLVSKPSNPDTALRKNSRSAPDL